MLDRNEVIEMITRQFDVRKEVVQYVSAKLSNLSTDELKKEFNKASLGCKLVDFGYNRFQITF
jgi:hypothetical protein